VERNEEPIPTVDVLIDAVVIFVVVESVIDIVEYCTILAFNIDVVIVDPDIVE
jgi:hypothetical protein